MIFARHLRLIRTYKTASQLGNIAASKCHESVSSDHQHKFHLSKPILNEKYLDKNNIAAISENIRNRKRVGDISLVHAINDKLQTSSLSADERSMLENQLQEELKKIPNDTHPAVRNYGEEPKEVAFYNSEPVFKHNPLEFAAICKKLNILRTEYLGNFAGHKSYYLMNDLAEMEQALIRYTLAEILNHGFKLMSVPDILPADVIKSCGMQTEGDRTQIYRLLPSELCLSGTSEMALAGYFAGSKLPREKMPIKVTAVSRCFRAETSATNEEKGIYRVHQFTKVEMFSVCSPSQSESILDEFKEIEIALFDKLGLYFKLIDMPPHELGSPAYRKYDIETYMPARKMWGEISSCSNCTDYQSRRLNITLDESGEFAHTVNGTACAIPRMLIAIIESFQNEDGTITIPEALRPYMKKDKIARQKTLPELKFVKHLIKKS